MPPEVYEGVDVGRRRQQQIVTPLVVADVEAPVLVHPGNTTASHAEQAGR